MAENRIHLRSMLQRLKHIHFKSDTILTVETYVFSPPHYDFGVSQLFDLFMTIRTPSGLFYCENLNTYQLEDKRVFFPSDFVLPEGAEEPVIDDDIRDERKYFIGWKRRPKYQWGTAPGDLGGQQTEQYALFLNIDSIRANLLARMRETDPEAELREVIIRFDYAALMSPIEPNDEARHFSVLVSYWKGRDLFPFLEGNNETIFYSGCFDFNTVLGAKFKYNGFGLTVDDNDSSIVYDVATYLELKLIWTDDGDGKLVLTECVGTPAKYWQKVENIGGM